MVRVGSGVAASVGLGMIDVAGAQPATKQTKIHPALRNLLKGSLLMDQFSRLYSISTFYIHPSREVSRTSTEFKPRRRELGSLMRSQQEVKIFVISLQAKGINGTMSI
jgi:hypothetical protein